MTCDQTDWGLREGELDCSDVRALLAVHFADMRADSPPEACHVLPCAGLSSREVRLFTAREKGKLLGIGALKDLGAGHGEVKSMRTAPEALGRGVGRFVLGHLVSKAREMGMVRLSLETGNSPLFDRANRLYVAAGFTRCSPFGGYAPTDFTHFYTLDLTAPQHRLASRGTPC